MTILILCACGCGQYTKGANRFINGHNSRRHSLHSTPEYDTWVNVIQRCTNKNHKSYPFYGGRGIFIAAEWRRDFTAFYRAIGPKPSPTHTIDRINNALSYVPGNIRWATSLEQSHNRRSPRGRFVTLDGEYLTRREIAVRIALNWGAYSSSLRRSVQARQV